MLWSWSKWRLVGVSGYPPLISAHVGSKVESALRNIQKFPQTLFPRTTYPVMSVEKSRSNRSKSPQFSLVPKCARCFFLRARCDTNYQTYPNNQHLPSGFLSTSAPSRPSIDLATSVPKSCNAAASPGFHLVQVFGTKVGWKSTWITWVFRLKKSRCSWSSDFFRS